MRRSPKSTFWKSQFGVRRVNKSNHIGCYQPKKNPKDYCFPRKKKSWCYLPLSRGREGEMYSNRKLKQKVWVTNVFVQHLGFVVLDKADWIYSVNGICSTSKICCHVWLKKKISVTVEGNNWGKPNHEKHFHVSFTSFPFLHSTSN